MKSSLFTANHQPWRRWRRSEAACSSDLGRVSTCFFLSALAQLLVGVLNGGNCRSDLSVRGLCKPHRNVFEKLEHIVLLNFDRPGSRTLQRPAVRLRLKVHVHGWLRRRCSGLPATTFQVRFNIRIFNKTGPSRRRCGRAVTSLDSRVFIGAAGQNGFGEGPLFAC